MSNSPERPGKLRAPNTAERTHNQMTRAELAADGSENYSDLVKSSLAFEHAKLDRQMHALMGLKVGSEEWKRVNHHINVLNAGIIHLENQQGEEEKIADQKRAVHERLKATMAKHIH